MAIKALIFFGTPKSALRLKRLPDGRREISFAVYWQNPAFCGINDAVLTGHRRVPSVPVERGVMQLMTRYGF